LNRAIKTGDGRVVASAEAAADEYLPGKSQTVVMLVRRSKPLSNARKKGR
jgi:hypothetical protein